LKHRKALSYGHFLSTPPSEQVVPNSNSSSSDEVTPHVIPSPLAACDQQLEQQVIATSSTTSNYVPNYLDDESTLETCFNNYMISSQVMN
jgi:hypothetical protein